MIETGHGPSPAKEAVSWPVGVVKPFKDTENEGARGSDACELQARAGGQRLADEGTDAVDGSIIIVSRVIILRRWWWIRRRVGEGEGGQGEEEQEVRLARKREREGRWQKRRSLKERTIEATMRRRRRSTRQGQRSTTQPELGIPSSFSASLFGLG